MPSRRELSNRGFSEQECHPTTSTRRVGALILFHQIYHGDAPILLDSMHHPPVSAKIHQGINVSPHSCCDNSIFNTAGHKRTFLPTVSRLWNVLPEEIVANRERDEFKRDVKAFLGALRQRPPPEWRGTAALSKKKLI